MTFSTTLNNYIDQIGCTAKELSLASNLSTSVISRYRKGERIPKYNSNQMNNLLKGLYILIDKYKINIDKETLKKDLEQTLNKNNINFDNFRTNFNTLINTLNINVSDLSKYIGFDSSYISKIKSGIRTPQHLDDFTNSIIKYITNNYQDINSKEKIASLLNIKIDKIEAKEDYFHTLNNWIGNTTITKDNSIQEFLTKLDEFELNEYIKSIKFDKIKVPTIPIQLPKSKTYYGIKGFKDSQIDTLKSIIFSKSHEDIFFYSNMSFIEGSKDIEFTKKFMIGLAIILKKGLHLHMIHDLDRPWKELMLGLNGWIPLYMTGQIHPYYFKDNSNLLFSNILCTSKTVSLFGTTITNNMKQSKFYMTNKKEEVSFYKESSKILLKQANSLMDIYNTNNKDLFKNYLNNQIQGTKRNIYYNLPIYTISTTLLKKVLKRNNILLSEQKEIIEYVEKEKEKITTLLKNNSITDEITIIKKEEYHNNECTLSLSKIFYEKRITYTYEEYLEHINLTKDYKNINYHLKINKSSIFKNINISITEKKEVMISKENTPSIHFVIHHPKLVTAIEKFLI